MIPIDIQKDTAAFLYSFARNDGFSCAEPSIFNHDFYAIFDDLLASAADKEYHEATRSAFLLDAAQVLHEDIYSKLFQN